MRTAICSGSYDPITLGHLDVIRRTADCFDQVYVCVCTNADKKHQMFSPEERLLLVQAAIRELSNVEAELFDGLLAAFAGKHGANVIVRGVRNGTDFDWEQQLATINHSICGKPDTLLLPASPACQHISSSMAREMIRYGQPLDGCLPPAVLSLVEEWRKDGKHYGK